MHIRVPDAEALQDFSSATRKTKKPPEAKTEPPKNSDAALTLGDLRDFHEHRKWG